MRIIISFLSLFSNHQRGARVQQSGHRYSHWGCHNRHPADTDWPRGPAQEQVATREEHRERAGSGTEGGPERGRHVLLQPGGHHTDQR